MERDQVCYYMKHGVRVYDGQDKNEEQRERIGQLDKTSLTLVGSGSLLPTLYCRLKM